MCGIVGLMLSEPMGDLGMLYTMRDTMCHRGPDDAGVWQAKDGRVGLAHRRLAIIDLSPGGHQPMLDAAQRTCITFNGEIYNYQDLQRELAALGHEFRTASDTEVILEAYRAWGTNCLSRFNGMFAFGLYDLDQERLFLARDRAGEKPLYYYHGEGTFLFASELKALMAYPYFPRKLDLGALEYFLAYGYVPGEKCILAGVHKLPSAHALTYDRRSDRLQIWRYWQLPESGFPPRVVEEDLVGEIADLLLDSVRLRLIADVPVGILLSGGIDSSLITAMAARVSTKPVKTFTITFPGHGGYDEGPFARLVAKHFGTDHVEMAAEPATVELLPKLARQYDEPIGDSSLVPTYMVSRLVRQHATVALGGDGGDELFAGYHHYSTLQKQERLRHFLPTRLRQVMGGMAARWLPPGVRGRNYLLSLVGDSSSSIGHTGIYFDRTTRRRLLAPLALNAQPEEVPELYKPSISQQGHSLLQQATRADFQTTLVDDFLVKVDRASMLNSLEVRVPWLDHRIIEFAFGRVPDDLKATKNERKILLRLLARRLLPRDLDLHRKQGFSLPLAAWFKGDWGKFIQSVLREAAPELFDRRTVFSLLAGQNRGYSNISRLFALTMFELWRREYKVQV